MTARFVAITALALVGCSDDGVDPITRITAPRVLAVITEPSVLGLEGEVRLNALTVDAFGPRTGVGMATPPNGRPVEAVRMRACVPWKFLADPARDCVGADALPLIADETGRFGITAAQLVAAFPPPIGGTASLEGLRAALAAGLELRVPIVAEVEVDGQTLTARRDLWVAETVDALDNPRITEVRFDGAPVQTLRAGQRYELTVTFDRQSLDSPLGDASEESPSVETVDCNFYSPSGELADHEADVEDPDVEVPETASNAYVAGPSGETWLYVIATDQTGGMTAEWLPITVE